MLSSPPTYFPSLLTWYRWNLLIRFTVVGQVWYLQLTGKVPLPTYFISVSPRWHLPLTFTIWFLLPQNLFSHSNSQHATPRVLIYFPHNAYFIETVTNIISLYYFFLLRNNWPQTRQLKRTHICDLTVSVVRSQGATYLVSFAQGLARLQSGRQWAVLLFGFRSSSKLTRLLAEFSSL